MGQIGCDNDTETLVLKNQGGFSTQKSILKWHI